MNLRRTITAAAFILAALFAVAGIGMSEETATPAGGAMSNMSTAAPAPMTDHSIPPAE